jgi:D-glutamate cyclase
MIADEKLRAIRDAIQQDVGNRGLARDPKSNLFNACPNDFAEACRHIAAQPNANIAVVTGFVIPDATPCAAETDGPLGTVFLARALKSVGISITPVTESIAAPALRAGLDLDAELSTTAVKVYPDFIGPVSHVLAIERVGPNHTWDSYQHQIELLPRGVREEHPKLSLNEFLELLPAKRQNRCFTMRRFDVTNLMSAAHDMFEKKFWPRNPLPPTIGIGDGGNEIGMGKIPWDTIRRNISSGEVIACRIPTHYLIVAGVSNWGAYALAAGIYVVRGVKPPADLFDPDREHKILEVMVREGPLVDGVTGKQTATVDGLSWDEYAKPLVRIREILESPWH